MVFDGMAMPGNDEPVAGAPVSEPTEVERRKRALHAASVDRIRRLRATIMRLPELADILAARHDGHRF
jgi:hypothetical protein